MEKRLKQPHLPILQGSQRKPINNKSRNIASVYFNKNNVKESFSSHLLTERNHSLHNNNFAFCSFDKNNPNTTRTNGIDGYKSNLSKFKMLNMKTMSINKQKPKPTEKPNLRLSHLTPEHISCESKFPRQPERKSPRANSNLLYLSNEYKNNDNVFEAKHTPRNVMNIVNNLHTNNVNHLGSNKNVEINFNKYEIKILSSKPTSPNSIQVKRQLKSKINQLQEQQIRKEDNKNKIEVVLYENNESPQEMKAVIPHTEIKTEGAAEPIKTENNPKKKIVTKSSLIIKTSFTDNDSSDSNLICLNRATKETKILKLVKEVKDNTPSLINSNKKDDEEQEKEIKEDNYCTINTINNNRDVFLRNIQMVSNACEMCFQYNKEPSVTDNPLIKIINEYNSDEDSNKCEDNEEMNNSSGLILGRKHKNCPLQLRNLALEKEKRSFNHSPSLNNNKENSNNLSIIIPEENNANKQNECESFLNSSSDSVVNKEETKAQTKVKAKQSFDKLFNMSPLRKSAFASDCNKPEVGAIEPFNPISSTLNSSLNLKPKDLSSQCSFFSKRASSVLLSPKKNTKIPPSLIQFKLQKQPKKNKRFIKQLSKISENTNRRISLSQHKPKLIKSSSLPIPKNKLIKSSSTSQPERISRKFSYSIPKGTPVVFVFANHQDSILLKKSKKSVIKEIEKSTESNHSDKSSGSSSMDKNDLDIIDLSKFKKGSLISRSTNSINFVDLRANSIRVGNDISKCPTLLERSFCQPFLEKQLNAIEVNQNDIEVNATDAKNELLSKTMLVIDIKCDIQEEKRRGTLTLYANKTLLQIESQRKMNLNDFLSDVDYFNEESFNKASEVMGEYDFYSNRKDFYSFANRKVFIYALSEKYFQFNLLYHLKKEKYLEQDIVIHPDSMLPNFSKKRKILKRQRVSLNSVNSERSRNRNNSTQNSQRKQRINYLYGINAAFCFNFIQNDDINIDWNEDDEKIKAKILQLLSQRYGYNRKTIKKKESRTILFNKKKTQQFKNMTSRLSISSKKSIDESNTPFSSLFKRKDSILQKVFYCRLKEDKDPQDENEVEGSPEMKFNIFFSRGTDDQGETFSKPFLNTKKKKKNGNKKEIARPPTHIADRMLIFNKESVMSQTHEIKSKILTKMNNYIDPLFFYIKDGNYQNFKDLFLKYKVNPETRDANGNTFLNIAVQCDCLRIAKFLIDIGSNVNSQNDRLNCPLHYALCYQNFALADILIKSGANESITNKFGLTPWQCINSVSTNI